MSEARPAPRPEKKRPPAEAGGVSVWGLLASDLVEGHATRNKCRCSETRGRHLEVDRLADGRTLRIFLHESRPFLQHPTPDAQYRYRLANFQIVNKVDSTEQT